MKTFTKLFLSLSVMLVGTLSTFAERFAYTFAGQTVYYERTENYTARVDYCPVTVSGGVPIPDEVSYQGAVWGPVTAVASNAFEDCIYITAVSLPASVTSIGAYAFKNCTSLTSVMLTASNERVDFSLYAFDGCSDDVYNSYDNAFYIGTGANPYLYLMKAASTNITSCQIHPDCKYINGDAFRNCDKLTGISIPNTITYIGGHAFDGCTSLTSITIPGSVTEISGSAFKGCSSLASLTLNSGVTTIGYQAFYGCSSLTTVTVPRSVTNIGERAFGGCSALESITLPFVGGAAVTSIDVDRYLFGYIFGTANFEGAVETSQYYKKAGEGSSRSVVYYIPSSLKTVTIDAAAANNVAIMENAFINCTELTSVSLNQVTSIEEEAFKGCTSLNTITVSKSVTSIARGAFYNCPALESMTLPFPGTQKYTPDMVETEMAENNGSIANGDTGIECGFLFGTIFQLGYWKTNNIPSTLKTVNFTDCEYFPYNTFYNYSSGYSMLSTVTLPNNLTIIGEKAFANCSGLTSITIPNNVTTVGENAYEGCASITSITTECTADLSATKLTFSKDGFNYRVLNKSTVELTGSSNTTGTVTIPATVTCGNTFTVISIAEYAFGSGFSNVNLISVPETVSTIGYHAFTNVPLLQYSGTAEGSPWGAKIRFSVIDGDFAYFDAEKTKLVAYFGTGGDVVVPNTVTEIYETAFRGNTTITSITLSANVTSIDNNVFYGCTALTSITIPESVTSIGDYAFSGCSNVQEFVFEGETPPTFGSSVFGGSTCPIYVPTIDAVTAYETADNMNSYASRVAIKPTFVVVDGVKYQLQNDGTFAVIANNYSGDIVIRNSVDFNDVATAVTLITANAFKNCTDLTAVTIPSGITSIGNYAFDNCTGLTSVTIPGSVTSIGIYAFSDCGLNSVTILEGVTSIGTRAFYECTGLKSVTIPESVTSIGHEVFYYCRNVQEFVFEGETPPTFGSGVFNTTGNCPIYVPTADAVTAYKAAENMTDYASRVQIMPIEVDGIRYQIQGDGTLAVVANNYSGDVNTIRESVDYNGVATAVTSIAANAFKNCTDLTAVTVPSSITSIGSDAFKSCTNLTKVIINSNAIASQTYTYNSNLVSIFGSQVKEYVLGEDVTEIGTYAFRECNNVISVIIPEGIKSIGASAFSFSYSSKLREFIFEGETPPTFGTSVFGGSSCPIYVPNETALSAYRAAENMNKYASRVQVRPIEVDGIRYQIQEDGTFVVVANNYSGDVVIPSSIDYNGVATAVTSIAAEAFSNCTDLTAVTIPSSITSIGSDAFKSCTNLTKVTLNSNAIASKTYTSSSNLKGVFGYQVKEYILGEEVTSIGNYAFYDCSYTLGFVFERETPPAFGTNVFYNTSCPIYVPNETALAAYRTAENMNNYASRVQVKPIEVDGVKYQIQEDGTFAVIANDYSGDVVIRSSVDYNGVATAVTSIAANAFKNCTDLTAVTIPSSITSIGSDAFKSCTNLTKVTLNSNAITSQSQERQSIIATIFGSQVKEYVLGEGVTTIGNYAFYGCSDLTSITIPESVTEIGVYAFSFCSNAQEFIFEGETPPTFKPYVFDNTTCPIYVPTADAVTAYKAATYMSDYASRVQQLIEVDGFKYQIQEDGTFAVLANNYSGDVVIPSSVDFNGVTTAVTAIATNAFKNCTDLTSITIPEGVTSIGSNSFYGCNNLTSVTTNSDASFSGASLYFIKDGIKYMVLDKNSVSVVANSYSGKIAIPENVTYGNTFNVTSIANSAFYNCTGLTSITIPEGVTSIGDATFRGCKSLTSATIPESVTSIGTFAFYGCTSLTSITIPQNVTSIPNYAFEKCTGLTSVTISEGVRTIYADAFRGCTGLTSVTIPSSVTSLSDAFTSCTNLTKVTLDSKNISKSYTKNTNLGTTFGNQVTEYVFVGEDVTSIGKYAFYGCKGLTSMTIPESVTSIGEYAFYDCTGLTSITIPDGVTSIGGYALGDCIQLTSVTIPESVTSINYYAFYNCRNAQEFVFEGETPPTFGTNVFYYTNGNSPIYVPNESAVTAYQSANNMSNYADRVQVNPIHTIAVVANNDEYGTVSGGGIYDVRVTPTVTISATAIEPYQFAYWNEDGSTEATRTITITENATYTAVFKRAITISNISAAEKVYDGTTTATATFTTAGIVESEDVVVDYTATFADANVGEEKEVTFTFSLSGDDKDNYILASETATVKANISANTSVVVTITENSASETYDGTEKTVIGYEVEINTELYKETDFTFNGTAEAKGTNAGEYEMNIAASDFENTNANFADVTFTVVDGKLTIEKSSETPNMPELTAETRLLNITDVVLPEGWAWADETIALVEGENQAVANYVGDDAGNYTVESVTITITRLPCLHNGEYTIVDAKEATCTADGYTGDHKCSICGAIFEQGSVIPAEGHKAGEPVVENYVAPTCTEAGTVDTVVYCTIDNEEISRKTSVLPATGHIAGEAVVENYVAPTCTEAGTVDTVYYCTIDGDLISRETYVLEAKGHQPGKKDAENLVPATITSEGSVDSVTYCTVCGEELSREHFVLPILDHEHIAGEPVVENYVAPTCNEAGAVDTVVYCTVNGEELSRKHYVLPALGHLLSEPVAENYVAPTCTEAGSVDTVVYCTRDNEEISRETYELEAKGHQPSEKIAKNYVAPTCLVAGSVDSVVTCTVCGEILSEEHFVLPALGHTAGEAVVENYTAPTCTEAGTVDTVYYCTIDNEEISRETYVLPMLEHVAGKKVAENYVAPTKTEEGSVDSVVYCTIGGEELSRESFVLPAIGHDHILGEPVAENYKAPTCTEAGSVDTVVYCLVEGEELSRDSYVLPALGHKPSEKVAKNYVAPTCLVAGSVDSVITCMVCGEILSEEHFVLPATGHTAGEPVVENYTAPTCTTTGTVDTVYYCTVDGEEISRETYVLPMLEHVAGEKVAENYVAPTFTAAGSVDSVVYCTIGGEELSRETFELPMLQKAIEKIEVLSMPKTEYVVGEDIDITGAKISVTFNDGSVEEIDLTNEMLSGFDNTLVAEQDITVTYLTFTTTIHVTVNEKTAISDIATDATSIYAFGHTIVVETTLTGDIIVNDVNGRIVAKSQSNGDRTEIYVPKVGVYAVRIGTVSQKVVVR